MEPAYLYFIVAFVACFVGAIPFGAINLSVVNVTLQKSMRKGLEFSVAASLVEILEASIAIYFGVIIQNFLQEYPIVQVIIFLAFIGIGIYYLRRKTNPKLKERSKLNTSEFVKGLAISIINPQAVPFWIFMLTFIAQYFMFEYTGAVLIWFLAGVFAGKIMALLLFALMSNFLREKLQKSCNFVNRSLGSILLLIGLIQAAKYFWG